MENFELQLPVDSYKVTDFVIECLLEMERYKFNSREIIEIGTHIIALTKKHQTDVELMDYRLICIQEYNSNPNVVPTGNYDFDLPF